MNTEAPTPQPHALLAPHQIIVRPLVTEKGMHRSTRYNAYAFEVNKMATKHDIRQAVEELFNVKVVKRILQKIDQNLLPTRMPPMPPPVPPTRIPPIPPPPQAWD